jgi:hypothetical protein
MPFGTGRFQPFASFRKIFSSFHSGETKENLCGIHSHEAIPIYRISARPWIPHKLPFVLLTQAEKEVLRNDAFFEKINS